MVYLYYIFSLLLIWFSFRSFRGGLTYLKYFKAELARPQSQFTPFATVIVPCKGIDDGLAENLTAVVGQDHPDFEVIFVVDDAADPAVEVIKNVAPAAALVIAATATESGQKVENLREAILHADPRSQVFAFADSDARPAVDWLRRLIAPLENENVGASTGYRWFISKNPTFASELRSAWNASIASALGPNVQSNFCWGGSMAMRREVFDELDMREQWLGTLSDDFAVTRAMKAAGRSIYFVPQALTPSVEDTTFAEMLEFTTRQMKITRVYAEHLWLLSFFGSGLFTSIMAASFLIVFFSRQNSFTVIWAIATLLLVSAFSIGKAALRSWAVSLVLTKYSSHIARQRFTQLTFWLLAPPVFLFNCFCALFSRRMTWRGVPYELASPNKTRKL